ncbi:MAG: hypothetical protein ABJA83_02130 [Burkholderiaceae bacterium]
MSTLLQHLRKLARASRIANRRLHTACGVLSNASDLAALGWTESELFGNVADSAGTTIRR